MRLLSLEGRIIFFADFLKRQSGEVWWRHSCTSSLRTHVQSVSPASLLLQCQTKFKYQKKNFEFPSSAPSLLRIEGCYGHIRFSCGNYFLSKKFPGLELVSSPAFDWPSQTPCGYLVSS